MMRLRPYRTVEDRIDGVVLSFVEITQRREAEDALRQSEERYRNMVADKEAEVLRLSAELERLSGEQR